MIEILHIEQDIISLEKRIISLIKKTPELTNIQGSRQFHLFWLWSDKTEIDITKEEYVNYSFLYYLNPCYFHYKPNFLKKEKKYIRATTLITDSTGNLMAIGDIRFLMIFSKESYLASSDMELAKMFFDKKNDFAFYLTRTSLGTYIAIKENNLYLLEHSKSGLKMYPFEEFINCCFDEWIYPKKKRE